MPPESLRDTDISDVPKNQLYRATRAVKIEQSYLVRPGEFLIVNDDRALAVEHRLFLETLRKAGNKLPAELAFFVFTLRNNVYALVPIAEAIHDGAGFGAGEGNVRERTLGNKENIKPMPVNAERVSPRTMKVKDIPRGRLCFLASTYQAVHSGERTLFYPASDEDVPKHGSLTRSGDLTSLLLSSVFQSTGACFSVIRKDDKWLVKMGSGTNGVEFLVDPTTELNVSIPDADLRDN